MSDFLPVNPAVSAVIPTRNRPASLARLLGSIAGQTRRPGEVIIVDASDVPADEEVLRQRFPSLNIRIIPSEPALCRQRNLGIARASGELILLADDDIAFPPGYLSTIMVYLAAHPTDGAVSGSLQEASGGTPPDRALLRPGRVLWKFVFQTSVWGDPAPLRGSRWAAPLLHYYRRRGNTFSSAGWPLLTDASPPAFRTAVYGLGGAVVRRSWLRDAPYDESLDRSGIGDNYGVALGLPGDLPVVVLTDISHLHHRAQEERLPPSRSYVLRVLALDYFMARSARFNRWNRLMLRWSLLGNTLGFALTGSFRTAAAAFAVLFRLLCGLNPYLRRTGALRRG